MINPRQPVLVNVREQLYAAGLVCPVVCEQFIAELLFEQLFRNNWLPEVSFAQLFANN
jgi:hypothetical protein